MPLLRSSFLNITVKKLWRLVYIWKQVIVITKSGLLLWDMAQFRFPTTSDVELLDCRLGFVQISVKLSEKITGTWETLFTVIQIRINTEITGPPTLVTWPDWWPTRWNSYYGISFPSHPWHSPLIPSRFPPLFLPFPHIPHLLFSISIFYTLFHSPNSFFSHTAWLCVVLFIEEREETPPSLPADSFIYFNYLNWRLLLTVRRQ